MDCLTAPSHYLLCWQWGPMIFIWGQFPKRYFNQQPITLVAHLNIQFNLPVAKELKINTLRKNNTKGIHFHKVTSAQINTIDIRLLALSVKYHDMSGCTYVFVNCLLSGVPDLFDRNKILSGGDLSHYQVPHCIRVFFYFVWFVFIHHNFQFYFELCTYCNILTIYLS